MSTESVGAREEIINILGKYTRLEDRPDGRHRVGCLTEEVIIEIADQILKLFNGYIKSHGYITEFGDIYYLIPGEEVKK